MKNLLWRWVIDLAPHKRRRIQSTDCKNEDSVDRKSIKILSLPLIRPFKREKWRKVTHSLTAPPLPKSLIIDHVICGRHSAWMWLVCMTGMTFQTFNRLMAAVNVQVQKQTTHLSVGVAEDDGHETALSANKQIHQRCDSFVPFGA